MLKIGFVGAPGSGKAMLTHQLWQETFDDVSMLMDNPGNLLNAYHDQAVGSWGTWREDLWVFFRTLEEEKNRLPRADGVDILLCNGTLLGPLAHAAAGLETVQLIKHKTDDMMKEILKRQQALVVLSMLVMENWDYDLLFYTGLVDPPAMPMLEWEYNVRVDKAIRETLSSLGLMHRTIKLNGDQPGRVNVVSEAVKSALDRVNTAVNTDEGVENDTDSVSA